MVWLSVFGIFNVHTDVDACHCTRGCTDTVRESALEVDSGGKKIPCRTWDSNPRQYCAWPSSRTLYPLSYPRPLESRQERRENCFLQGQLSVLALIGDFSSTPVVSTLLMFCCLTLWLECIDPSWSSATGTKDGVLEGRQASVSLTLSDTECPASLWLLMPHCSDALIMHSKKTIFRVLFW